APLIESALEAAASGGVQGQAVTPSVLARLHAESGGRTLRANRDLIVGNARLAGEIAAGAGRSATAVPGRTGGASTRDARPEEYEAAIALWSAAGLRARPTETAESLERLCARADAWLLV